MTRSSGGIVSQLHPTKSGYRVGRLGIVRQYGLRDQSPRYRNSGGDGIIHSSRGEEKNPSRTLEQVPFSMALICLAQFNHLKLGC